MIPPVSSAWPLYSIVMVVLIVLSAFFSGSETALTAVNRFRVRYLAKTNKRARLIQRILARPERLLGTLLLCNNLVNVGLSTLAGVLLVSVFGPEGVLYATIAVTLALLVFSEITPKTIAAYHSEKVALAISPLLHALVRICYPVVRVLSWMSDLLIRLIGMHRDPTGERVTGEDIRSLIEVSAEDGALAKDQQDMLLGIFTIDTSTVGDVMVHMRYVETLPADATRREVLEAVKSSGFSRYPIHDESLDDVIGFVHVRDVLVNDDEESFSLRKIMRQPHFVPELRSVRQQLLDFQAGEAHMSFVVDEYGAMVGIVTLEDILEEIVGEIQDEHDTRTLMVQEESEGSYLVRGRALIRDVNRWMSWRLPEGTVRTMGGLVVRNLGRLPKTNDEVDANGYRLRITEMRGKRIRYVRVWLPGISPEDDTTPEDETAPI